jgi:hypothetical protein
VQAKTLEPPPRRARRLALAAVAVLTASVFGAVTYTAASATGSSSAGHRIVATATTEDGPDDSAVLDGAPTPPTDLGDDDALDALAASCFDGELLACDHLFLQSPTGSDYERYGDTCGGRQEAGTGQWCALVAADNQPELTPPEGLGDDPELDALAQSCYDGDLQACDDLYAQAEPGSSYLVYGDTCAGRQPENTQRYCTDLAVSAASTTVPVSAAPESSEPGASSPPTTVPTPTIATTQPGADVTTTAPAIPAPTQQPTGLGTDASMDALAQSCFDGDMQACDDLYYGSPIGSAYESYAETCAGRSAPIPGLCVATFAPDSTSTTSPTLQPAPAPTQEPTGLGTDASMDALAQSCFDGDMQACDELYVTSPIGSAYESFGETCAGRTEPIPGSCASTFESSGPASTVPTTTAGAPTTVAGVVPPATQQPTGLGTDAQLDGLAQSCYDGDMQACDDLFFAADVGSAYESYGDTCAGRQPPFSGLCTDAFGSPATTATPTVPATTEVPLPTVTLPSTTVPPPATTAPTAPTVPVSTVTVPATTEVPLPTVTLPSTTVTPSPTTALPPTTVTGGPSTTIAMGIVPPPTLQPTGLGTDPALDVLAQSCYDGDMGACDDLWRRSDQDSAYRDYGDTCAGRQPPLTTNWCVDSFPGEPATTIVPTSTAATPTSTAPGIPPATHAPTGLGSDPALDALAQGCYAGDMTACDALFKTAPLGSAYQVYGDTCAGRQPAGTFTYCRAAFPG